MRAVRGRAVAAVVGLVLAAATSGAAATSAAAEVLVNQPPGPSGVAVPSTEMPGGIAASTEAMDDFVVPPGTRWRPEGITVFGRSMAPDWRGFSVRIWEVIPGVPYADWYDQLYSQGLLFESSGTETMISIAGGLSLGPGDYWIAVQQFHADHGGSWSWLTGPDTAGTMPASFLAAENRPAGAEAGQAFKLTGTAFQTLTVSAEGYGLIRSEPPGIACTTTCTGEFPRGTDVKLTEEPSWGLEFKGWQWGTSLQGAPPCTTENGCTFPLNDDTRVLAKAAYRSDVTVSRLVRDRRTGGGELVVWLPNEGVLSMSGSGLRSVPRTTAPKGSISVPLEPRGELARRLLRKGSATVTVAIRFRPAKGANPATIYHRLTLVRERPHRPIHKPAHGVH